jgi:hypothetical protein
MAAVEVAARGTSRTNAAKPAVMYVYGCWNAAERFQRPGREAS